MSFSDRSGVGSRFEKRLFEKIQDMGFVVALNGTEHTHPEFVKLLHRSVDQCSLAIRFQPDGVACVGLIPRSFYIEAKAAKTIEKSAYNQYMKLHGNGNIIVIVFEKFNWEWNFINEVELIDGSVSVARYPVHKRFPLDEDGWMYPRKTTHGTGRRGSGTPYKYIKRSSLRPWCNFKIDTSDALTR